jgi:hypothetical protein
MDTKSRSLSKISISETRQTVVVGWISTNLTEILIEQTAAYRTSIDNEILCPKKRTNSFRLAYRRGLSPFLGNTVCVAPVNRCSRERIVTPQPKRQDRETTRGAFQSAGRMFLGAVALAVSTWYATLAYSQDEFPPSPAPAPNSSAAIHRPTWVRRSCGKIDRWLLCARR